jgi:hypothetical protein
MVVILLGLSSEHCEFLHGVHLLLVAIQELQLELQVSSEQTFI